MYSEITFRADSLYSEIVTTLNWEEILFETHFDWVHFWSLCTKTRCMMNMKTALICKVALPFPLPLDIVYLVHLTNDFTSCLAFFSKGLRKFKNSAVILSRLHVFRDCHDGHARDAADVFPFPIWHSFFLGNGTSFWPRLRPCYCHLAEKNANNMIGWWIKTLESLTNWHSFLPYNALLG